MSLEAEQGTSGAGINASGQELSKEKLWTYRRDLFIVSVLALFCELLIIRWLATEVRIFAYFKNLPLMSAFLGLGLGFLWSGRKRDYFNWSAIGLLYMSGLLIFALGLGITYLSFVDPLQFLLFGTQLGGGAEPGEIWPTVRSLAIMSGIFALSTSIFVGLGQRMGRSFAHLRPLEAYSINVTGSLVGTVLFSLVSWLGTSPGVWLVLAGAMFLLVHRRPSSAALVVLGLLYSLFLGTYIARTNYGPDFVKTVWSPYYRIDVVGVRQPEGPYKGELLGYNLYINYDSFQSMLDSSQKSLERFPPAVRQAIGGSYSAPFRVLDQPGARVLVLGSGTGSDVAAALRAGAAHVDAIEIDPAILQIGRAMHPEHPYSSNRVDARVMDARTFLKNANNKYDLVIFAALDSHAAFSAMSSLRLDNYVFTREALREAVKLLDEDGIVAVNFVAVNDWLWDRHAAMLADAAGMKPLGYLSLGDQNSGLLLAGPGVAGKNASALPVGSPVREVDLSAPVPMSEDDWPFLFLPRRELPLLYLLPILTLLALGILPVASHFSRGARVPLHWQMFALGMAFMLLEVRAIADLSLLFGSTWVVNSVIIGGVMVVILLANWLAWHLKPPHVIWLGWGVTVGLAVTGLVGAGEFSRLGPWLGGLAGAAMYLFPLVFGAAMFALLFKQAKEPTTAFAFNLVGGVIGVCLEYLSMWLGIRALVWIAIAIYATVMAIEFWWRRCKRSQTTAVALERS